MSNLLSAILNQENANRGVEQAIRQSEADEFRKVVKSIHAAYAGYSDQVQGLVLRGDYNNVPVVFRERRPNYTKVEHPEGLKFFTGSTIIREEIVLQVTSRENETPGKVTLSIERHHPHKSSVLHTFPLDTPAEHMVEQAFRALMPFLHADSFPAKQQATA